MKQKPISQTDRGSLRTSSIRAEDAITLAVSSHWNMFPEKFDWLVQHGFGLEYAPNREHLHLTREHLTIYQKQEIPIRYHGYFPGFEFGDIDRQKAEEALQLHLRAMDVMKGLGEQVMTIHVGLPPFSVLDYGRVITNLTRIVAYGQEKGVTICLENLRKGPTSKPETVLEWAELTGASITMDIGHAVSCECVADGEFTVPEIVRMFSHLLKEVHFYESETDTHHAPEDMSVLGPVVDELLQTDCRWWTIELNDYDEILNTRNLIQDYLTAKTHHSLAA